MPTDQPDIVKRAEPFMQVCGVHDYGIHSTSCACPEGDFRPIVAALVSEVERLRQAIEEQPEPAPEQAKARAVARELLRIIPEAMRADIARGVDDDDNRLMLAEIFEAARPLVGNPVARPLVLPVAKLAQRMYAQATAEQPEGSA